MAKRATRPAPRRVVWRISKSAPLGEFVDLDAVPRKPAPTAAPVDSALSGGWILSSFELLDGTDIDDSGDTVPDDLFDELFRMPVPSEPSSETP